jgi:hypothetical protein
MPLVLAPRESPDRNGIHNVLRALPESGLPQGQQLGRSCPSFNILTRHFNVCCHPETSNSQNLAVKPRINLLQVTKSAPQEPVNTNQSVVLLPGAKPHVRFVLGTVQTVF